MDQALLRRLAGINREQPHVHRLTVTLALRRHLDAAGLPPSPIRWVNDAEAGFLAAVGQTENRLWLALLRQGHRSPAGGLCPGLWTDAEWVARTTAEEGAWQRAKAAWGIPYAIRCWITPRTAASLASRAIYCANDKQEAIWLPFADAFEAGLWLVWVLRREIVAVPRPDIRSEADASTHPTVPL